MYRVFKPVKQSGNLCINKTYIDYFNAKAVMKSASAHPEIKQGARSAWESRSYLMQIMCQ